MNFALLPGTRTPILPIVGPTTAFVRPWVPMAMSILPPPPPLMNHHHLHSLSDPFPYPYTVYTLIESAGLSVYGEGERSGRVCFAVIDDDSGRLRFYTR